MSATVALSATLTLAGNALSIAKSYTAEYLRTFEFELAASAVYECAIHSTTEGTDLQMLYIRAVNAADSSQDTAVSYGTDDAEASDAASGTAWKSVNGFLLAWQTISLSTANKLHIYNSGANRAKVTVALGLDGA